MVKAPCTKRNCNDCKLHTFGTKFTALNGGAIHFKFTDGVSFVVNCENQEEVDYYWDKLTEGGQEVACGWLKR